ncbi:MAG: oligosaccharide flippase family protein [Fluviicola sp.]|nr:oligosaccharide flippase family protein [Fluviicola sp.]
MQQIFLRGLGITLLLNLLVKPATIFGVDVVMQNEIGLVPYGDFSAFLNFTFLFCMILDMGITNYMTRLIAQHPHLIRQYSHQLFTLRLFLAVIYIIWTVSLFFLFGLPINYWWMLGLLIIHQISINTVNYVRAYTGGLMRFKLDAVLSVIERLVYLILGLLLLYTTLVRPISLGWFVGIFVSSSFISFLFAGFVYVSLVEFPRWKWNTIFFKAIFKQSFPYALLVILMMLNSRIDTVFIKLVHPNGATQVSYYVQGFRLLDACWMFGILFGGILLPIFSRLLKEKESVSGIMTNAFNLLISAGLLMVVLSIGTREILFDALYKDATQMTYDSWIFLSISFLPMCFTLVFGTLLTANGSLRQLNIMAIIALSINVILNIILIPILGAKGAAITTLTAQTVFGVLQWILVRYRMNERLQKAAWVKLGSLAVVLGTMLCLRYAFDWNIIYWIATLFFVWFVWTFSLRIIDVRAVLSLLKKS